MNEKMIEAIEFKCMRFDFVSIKSGFV